MNIPENWQQPKYCLGNRVKQGLIVGMQYYPENSRAAYQENGSKWCYRILRNILDNVEDIDWFEESQINPLDPEAHSAKIQQEINNLSQQIQFLKTELTKFES